MIELALGTVQFGLAYGLSERPQRVSDQYAKDILGLAAQSGIRRLDTAAAYGDIERRLSGLIGDLDFEIVSKIPDLSSQDDDLAAFVTASIQSSYDRLGLRLRGMLFHNAADLKGADGELLWQRARQLCDTLDLSLGVSVYDPYDASTGDDLKKFDMVQLPGNALDQRVVDAAATLGDAEISLRSAFLQGLLLMPYETAVCRVPAAAGALRRWHNWCAQQDILPLVGALSIVKAMAGVRYCVVGVDDARQLEDILAAWDAAVAVNGADLAVDSLAIIDPRYWKVAG